MFHIDSNAVSMSSRGTPTTALTGDTDDGISSTSSRSQSAWNTPITTLGYTHNNNSDTSTVTTLLTFPNDDLSLTYRLAPSMDTVSVTSSSTGPSLAQSPATTLKAASVQASLFGSDYQFTQPVAQSDGILKSSINWLSRVSGLDDVTMRLKHGPFYPSHENIHYYQHLLDAASNFEQWHAAASQLDILEGKEDWKNDPKSEDYEYDLVKNRLAQLRKAREIGDISAMIFLLRTSLSRNLGDIGNPALYSVSRVGTKVLIDKYIDEVVRQLNMICDTETADLTLDDKLDFFLNTRQSFGRTALLLSGGATLGLNHIGVIKALHECHLLPRIISGASVGSLIAALVCSKTDAELMDAIRVDNLNANALEDPAESGSFIHRISRFLKHGVLFDVEVLISCVRANIGDVTFHEAYNRTRRILNITVSSSTKFEMPKLLNYITAPNVLIWSAVAASCAIPFFYRSAPLMARDKSGKIVPWNPSGHRWIDGSVENDLPMDRLSEMFNVNHFIVCQVNPHVVPFLKPTGGTMKSALSLHPALKSAFFLCTSEFQHRLNQLIELDIFPTMLYRIQNVISQRYDGDITIVPDIKWKDYLQLVSNPTPQSLFDSIVRGERATWPQISIVRNHCQIELNLDEILYRLRIRKLDMNLPGNPYQKLYQPVARVPHNPYSTMPKDLAQTLQTLVSHPTRNTLNMEKENNETLASSNTPVLSRSHSFTNTKSATLLHTSRMPNANDWESSSSNGDLHETSAPARRVKSMNRFQVISDFDQPLPAKAVSKLLESETKSRPKKQHRRKHASRSSPSSPIAASLGPSFTMTPLSSGGGAASSSDESSRSPDGRGRKVRPSRSDGDLRTEHRNN